MLLTIERRQSSVKALSSLLLIALFVLLPPPPLVAAEVHNVTADELLAILQPGQKLRLVLKDSTRARGRLIEASPVGLQVEIAKSKNRAELPLGVQLVPLASLTSVGVEVYKGKKRWKLPVILTSTVGFVAIWVALATEENQGTYVPPAVAFTVALGVGGHFLGKAWDRKVIVYVLETETQHSDP